MPNTSCSVWQAKACCLRWLLQLVRRADSRAICTAGNNKATRTPMMAMTTSNSTKVNPDWRELGRYIVSPPERKIRQIAPLQVPLISLLGCRFVPPGERKFREVPLGNHHRTPADVGHSTFSSRPGCLVGQDRKHLLVVGWAAPAGIQAPNHDIGLAIVG